MRTFRLQSVRSTPETRNGPWLIVYRPEDGGQIVGPFPNHHAAFEYTCEDLRAFMGMLVPLADPVSNLATATPF